MQYNAFSSFSYKWEDIYTETHVSTCRERQACLWAATYLNVYTKSYTRKPGKAFAAFHNISDKALQTDTLIKDI